MVLSSNLTMYTKLKHRHHVSYYLHSNVVLSPTPTPSAHTRHTSCIDQSSSPNHLRKLSVSDTRSFFLSMFRSLTLSTTQLPFSTMLPNVSISHPPLHSMSSSLSISLSLSLPPSHPLSLDTCID